MAVAIVVPWRLAVLERETRREIRIQRGKALLAQMVGSLILVEARTGEVHTRLSRPLDMPPGSVRRTGLIDEVAISLPPDIRASMSGLHEVDEDIAAPLRAIVVEIDLYESHRTAHPWSAIRNFSNEDFAELIGVLAENAAAANKAALSILDDWQQ